MDESAFHVCVFIYGFISQVIQNHNPTQTSFLYFLRFLWMVICIKKSDFFGNLEFSFLAHEWQK
jgi:hypothetical protein